MGVDNKELIEKVELLKSLRIVKKDAEIADSTGFPRSAVSSYLSNRIKASKNFIEKFTDVYEMYFDNKIIESVKSVITNQDLTHAPAGKFPKSIGMANKPVPVPFYDVDFAAGDIEMFDDANALQPAYMMDIPEFSGCTAFRVFSNSMERLIISGSILFGTKVSEWNDHLEFGQVYGIICQDKRRYLKYIRKAPGKDDTHFLLRSENVEEFDDFLMPKSKIKSIWLIHGWLQKRN
jgi:hypothetical protein